MLLLLFIIIDLMFMGGDKRRFFFVGIEFLYVFWLRNVLCNLLLMLYLWCILFGILFNVVFIFLLVRWFIGLFENVRIGKWVRLWWICMVFCMDVDDILIWIFLFKIFVSLGCFFCEFFLLFFFGRFGKDFNVW